MKDKQKEEEELVRALERGLVKPFQESLSHQVDDLLRRIPALSTGPICPSEDDFCRCTYQSGCRALINETENEDTGCY